MKLISITPKRALNKAYLQQRPLRSEIENFKKNLKLLLEKLQLIDQRPKDESEEHLKNDLRDFLRDTFYRETNAINTKERNDLVIHSDRITDSKVSVILEAKRPTNKLEMITINKPNAKALQELVLYYLRERIDGNNIDIKYLVVTNINEWYIFESSVFEKHFFKNKSFVKQYEDWRDGKKVSKETSLFYNEIAKPYIDLIEDEICCTYFNIKDYEKFLLNTDKEDDKNLIALYKILSPIHLLKLPFSNDSNELDVNFYKELLHIIGLEDAKEDGKNIIRRKKEKRNAGALIEKVIDELKTEGLHKLSDVKAYGDTVEKQTFNVALELCITWINRILFLKLLEGQLISYHKGNKQFRFLNSETVPDFDELFKLFHKVLAVSITERNPSIAPKYERVPYLNSSLFEISDLEDYTIKINALDNSSTLDFYSNSILKEEKKKGEKLKTLDYFFKFLDSYDFASEGEEDIEEDNKPLINASVLGKVFEKINGYKDGSIYTPGFVTMYMCEKSIRAAVINKFKEKYKWNIDSIDDLRNYLSDKRSSKEIKEFNEVINSLHICDPAVGSGHFLVSALNELIAVKSELGLFADENGNRITDYHIEISNDELFVTDHAGNIFKYQLQNHKPEGKEMQRLQKTLFREKQLLIENCLFGVDINHNSVKICRLRLWIELLKNAYYKEETNFIELETLPNIDINIKCGNSLISRFPLEADLSKALKSIKYSIKEYRGFVNDYKNEKNRDVKKGLQKIIDSIKSDFKTQVGKESKEQKKLDKLSSELYDKYYADKLFAHKLTPEQKKHKAKLEKQVSDQKKIIDEINNSIIFKSAFEWRFEFPEVLDNKGEFEGFDLVIGNPPYISANDLKKSLSDIAYKFLKETYQTAKGTVDLFIYFFELGHRLLKKDAPLSFITPNRYLSASYGEALREFLFLNSEINEIVDYSHVKVFKEASTYPIVTCLTKRESPQEIYPIIIGKYDSEKAAIDYKDANSEKLNFLEGYIWGFLLNDKIEITEKIINSSVSITSCAEINATSTAAEADLYHDLICEDNGYKLVNTGTIDRYETQWGKQDLVDQGEKYKNPYLDSDSELISQNRKKLYESPKIILAKIAIRTEAFYDESGSYASINTNCFHTFNKRYDPKYILAWLNSKLFQYTFECFFEGLKMAGGYLLYSSPNISKMYIKEIEKQEQKPFINLVDQILKSKENGKDSLELEKEIDLLFYKLFKLTSKEQKIIESNFSHSSKKRKKSESIQEI